MIFGGNTPKIYDMYRICYNVIPFFILNQFGDGHFLPIFDALVF